MSFEGPYEEHEVCTFPCITVPAIAPYWADLDFRFRGRIYYRSTQDAGILEQVAEMIANVNPGLNDYQPTEALIVTWFEAMLTPDVSFFQLSSLFKTSG